MAISDVAGADTSTPAVVLKLDPNVMHHGGLGVIRSLGRIGVGVYGVHEGRLAPAASSRYLRGRYFWQPGSDAPGEIAAGLHRLAARIGRPAVLLPTDDAGAIFLAEHGASLRSEFIFPDQPAGLPRQLAGKFSLYELCRDLGVPAVAAAVPSSAGEARAFAREAGFPLIGKLTTPWVTSSARGSHSPLRSTSIFRTQAELDAAWAACEEAGAGLMLQEFIPDSPEGDWFFHGYCDADSVCRPAFTGVKERSYPAHAGLTSLGRAEPNPELRELITTLLARIGYRGIMDMDLRRDPRDGQYKLLDFNPRLGAQFRLFATTAGVDVATAAYLDLTGQPIPAGEPARRRFVVENYDPIGAVGYWRRGELTPGAFLTSLRHVDEAAWFARDDLAPFGLMCLQMGWRLAARPAAGLAGRAASKLTTKPSTNQPGRSRLSGTNQQGGTSMTEAVDVAIVGAGPYGLSAAAHLRAAGLSYRQFGFPMRLWREMPTGMYLKSQGFASNLSDPEGSHTLEAYCRKAGLPYQSYGLPVSLEIFTSYGQWFADELVPGWEEIMVTDVTQRPGGFAVTLADGEVVLARNVVLAAGVEHFTRMPGQFDGLPSSLASHISRYSDMTAFAGQRVAVVGAGQYALESAALLHEGGAEVRLVARADQVVWNGGLLESQRTLRQRMREPESGLGSGWSTWFYSCHPELFRRLPERTRIHRARTALGPAGAHWLRDRVEGQFPVHVGTTVQSATVTTGAGADATARETLRLDLVTRSGSHTEVEADHLIAATGYRPDLNRLKFVDPALRAQLGTVDGSPSVGPNYQSAVPGLFVIGPAVAPSYGPVMRFVYGADHAATMVARALAGSARTGGRRPVAAMR